MQPMEINNNTKISAIIKADKASIDAIAAVAKPLERLKNPLLRKIMASRVTLSEAAKMGGTTTEAIAKALEPLGYRYSATKEKAPGAQQEPAWLTKADHGSIIVYDVRPIIEEGTDPLKEILHRFKSVPAGGIFCIVNSFIPTPLIHLLEKEKAAASYVKTISASEFHTFFLKGKKTAATAHTEKGKIIMDDPAAFEQVCARFSSESRREIDVRALEMPGPMQAILAELETLPASGMLYIHHKRVPVYLLEVLADKELEVHISNVDEGNVKMVIFKPNG